MKDFFKRAIASHAGDSFAAIRLSKAAVRAVNGALGDPLAVEPSSSAPVSPVAPKRPEPAPVMIYFEKDRNQRLLERIEETLVARSIAFRKLDVSGDEAT